ncbi:MAG: SMC-Scp complex subunit ScpB [Planctomycetales bacterium]
MDQTIETPELSRPFQVVVSAEAVLHRGTMPLETEVAPPDDATHLLEGGGEGPPPPSESEPIPSDELADPWGSEAIEQAYQKALAAFGDGPWEGSDTAVTTIANDESETISEVPDPAASLAVADAPVTSDSVPEAIEEPPTLSAESSPIGAPPAATPTDPIDAVAAGTSPQGPRLASGTDRSPRAPEGEAANVTPVQIIEAALFVGGAPLTAKKLCGLLRGSFDASFVEQTIDDLNARYHADARPYEIRLGDGGYRLELRAEFEKLRHRVYGSGPREVKLSQEVLEVLALVAYRQPLSQQEVESHGKANAGNLLRQLLRRDLVAIQRGEGGRKDIKYVTTPRFLALFGLGSLEELPRPDDLDRK